MSAWTAFWSERAGRAEQDSDRMAALLDDLVRKTNDLPYPVWAAAQDALRDYRANRDFRYRALPAGPTQIGNFASGGIAS